MLRMFDIQGAKLRDQNVDPDNVKAAMGTAIWIDAAEPTEDERDELNKFLRAELPESDDVEEIEFSARYFQDNAGIHVHSLFLSPTEGRHSTTTVAFILQDKRLITLRDGELADFRLLRMRARRGQVQAHSPQDLLITMFEQKVENLADVLEDIHRSGRFHFCSAICASILSCKRPPVRLSAMWIRSCRTRHFCSTKLTF